MTTKLHNWDTATDGPRPCVSRRFRAAQPVRLSDADGEWYGWELDGGKLFRGVRVLNSAAKQAEIDAAIAAEAANGPLRIGPWLQGGPVVTTPPIDVDYKTGLVARLAHKVTMIQGEVTAIDYYDDATHTVRVIGEVHTYNRDASGFAQSRDIVISWYREDDTPHPTTKTLHKVYDARESIREGKTRRSNIVDRVEYVTAGLLLATEVTVPDTDPAYPAQAQAALDLGRAFLKSARAEIGDFIEGSVPDILTAVATYAGESIQHAPAAWMDNVIDGAGTTIRMVITAEIDIWS